MVTVYEIISQKIFDFMSDGFPLHIKQSLITHVAHIRAQLGLMQFLMCISLIVCYRLETFTKGCFGENETNTKN